MNVSASVAEVVDEEKKKIGGVQVRERMKKGWEEYVVVEGRANRQ